MHTISTIRVLSDNFVYIVHNKAEAIVIDPGSAQEVLQFLGNRNLSLDSILLTHHHFDHTSGVEELKSRTGCTVIGSAERHKDNIDDVIQDGNVKKIIDLSIEVVGVPGHTRNHVAYFIPELKALFTGDTLFAAGCGRLFEGTAEQMWNSLMKLSALGDDVYLYCGHEYTEDNLLFAISIEPANITLKNRLENIRNLLSSGKNSVPSLMSEEKLTNPFLRAKDVLIRQALGMETASDVEVFAELRRRKDVF